MQSITANNPQGNGSPVFFHKTQLKRDIAIFKREIGVIRGLDSRSEWQEERLLKMKQKEEEQERILELSESWVSLNQYFKI